MNNQNNKTLSEEQIALLKKPLPKEAISQHPTKKYLSSIKAIYVTERLNEVFGLGGWRIANEVVEAGEKMIIIKATFYATDYGITIPDIFGGNDNPDRGDAYKGACTDALTKIGSYLYIGMDVYKGLADKPEMPKLQERTKNEISEFTDVNDLLKWAGLQTTVNKLPEFRALISEKKSELQNTNQ